MRHRICGLSLQAASPLPGFLPDDTPSPPDTWQVSLGATPLAEPRGELVFRSDRELADAVEAWRPRAGVLQLAFGDGTAALVDAPARTIEVAWPAHQDFDDALTYLVGPVLGAAQRLGVGVAPRGGADHAPVVEQRVHQRPTLAPRALPSKAATEAGSAAKRSGKINRRTGTAAARAPSRASWTARPAASSSEPA